MKRFFKKLKRFVSNEEREELKFLKFEELYKNFQSYEKFRKKDPLEDIWKKYKQNFKSAFFYYDMYNNENKKNTQLDITDDIDEFLKNKESADNFLKKIQNEKKNFSDFQNKVDTIVNNLKENDFSKRLNNNKIEESHEESLSSKISKFSNKEKIKIEEEEEEENEKNNFDEELSKLDEEFDQPILKNEKVSSSFKKNYKINKSSRKKKNVKIKNSTSSRVSDDRFDFFS